MSRSPSRPILFLLAVSVIALASLAMFLRSSPHAQGPTLALQEAQNSSPYRIRRPGYLPAAASLTKVDWNAARPERTSRSTFSVDLWYALGSGTRLHVWETNDPLLAESGKDPAAEAAGVPVDLDGTVWRLVRLPDATTVLSAHMAQGITVSADAVLGDATLERIAQSIR